MPHDSPFLSVGHSVARKTLQRRNFLIIARDNQRENLLKKAKQVDAAFAGMKDAKE